MKRTKQGPSAFDLEVWAEVQRIGWSETRTYADVAEAIGSSAHPVGSAFSRLERYPEFMVVVPWHRVVQSGGQLSPINDRTREQARLLVLEGHVLEVHTNSYRLVE